MDILNFITQYWFPLLALVGVIISFATLKSKNDEQECRIKALEDENKNVKTLQQSIEATLASIKTDLEWIKRTLDK